VGEYASGSSSGWTALVAASPTLAGTAGLQTGGDITDQTGNPTALLNSGVASLDLWSITETKSGVRTTLGSWTDLGTFNINPNSDTITFTTAPMPEPGASSLLAAGAGLLLVGVRHQLKRKNA
jgi:hypothetical protein